MRLRTHALAVALALATLTIPMAAARAAAPPALAGDARSLVEAERAFARLAATTSTRDAFLAVLADSGVLFQPLAVNGKRFHESRPARPGVLAWEPEYAEVAGSGELGFTTGPWSFQPTREDTAVAFGHYVSVWRREAEGPWRLHADLGISHERPATLAPTPVLRDATRAATKPGDPAALASLRAAELALRGAASLARAAASDVRVLHGDRAPALGAAGVERLRGESAGTRWALEDLRVSRAGDLGYARGLRFAADTASYVRLWRLERDGWRVALDIENPAR